MRGEDALFDEFAVSYVGRSNANGAKYVRYTSREDSHSCRDEHTEETPSDATREHAETRSIVRTSFDAKANTFASSSKDAEFEETHDKWVVGCSPKECLIDRVENKERCQESYGTEGEDNVRFFHDLIIFLLLLCQLGK